MTDTFAQLERVKDTAEELHRYVTLTAKERDAWRDQAQKLKAALELALDGNDESKALREFEEWKAKK